ncbi:hypothetical protein ACFDR9_005189 [Janthinobacterium sp. CG_23.3]|uniref:hypothetical protein n=1 Tax=Janthinobacterium sp. CG_23.3 TaxID=3349634 RepID=UPI0038D50E60
MRPVPIAPVGCAVTNWPASSRNRTIEPADIAGLVGAGIINLVIDQEITERRPGYEPGQRPRAGVIDKPHWWTRFRWRLVIGDSGGQPISFGSAHGQLLDLSQGLVHVAGESVIPLLDSRAKERGVAS